MILKTCSANSLCAFVGDPVTQLTRFGAQGGRKRNLSGTRLVDPTPITVAGSAPATGRDRSVLLLGLAVQAGARLAHRDRGTAAGLGDLVVLTVGVAVDLELDPRLRADLEAGPVGGILGGGLQGPPPRPGGGGGKGGKAPPLPP